MWFCFFFFPWFILSKKCSFLPHMSESDEIVQKNELLVFLYSNFGNMYGQLLANSNDAKVLEGREKKKKKTNSDKLSDNSRTVTSTEQMSVQVII